MKSHTEYLIFNTKNRQGILLNLKARDKDKEEAVKGFITEGKQEGGGL